MNWHKLDSDLFVTTYSWMCAIVRCLDNGWQWIVYENSAGEILDSGVCDDLLTAQSYAATIFEEYD